MDVDEINTQLGEAIKQEQLLPRGMKMKGVVVSTKRKKTATIERQLVKYISKYSRWASAKSKVSAHVPMDVDIKDGDVVEIQQIRKVSKTKSWIITKIIKRGE